MVQGTGVVIWCKLDSCPNLSPCLQRQQNLGDVPELPGYQTAAAPGAALVTLQRPAGLQRGSVRAPLPPLPLSQAALPELQQHVEPAAWPLGLERQASSIQEDSGVQEAVQGRVIGLLQISNHACCIHFILGTCLAMQRSAAVCVPAGRRPLPASAHQPAWHRCWLAWASLG